MREFSEEEIREIMLSATKALYEMVRNDGLSKDKPINSK